MGTTAALLSPRWKPRSPSAALTYILGSVILGWSGDAERAIEWSERGVRLSPFDPWAFAAFDAQAMSHLLRGRYEAACRAAYKSVQANSAHSITYVQLAAALAKLGRLEEARAAAARANASVAEMMLPRPAVQSQ